MVVACKLKKIPTPFSPSVTKILNHKKIYWKFATELQHYNDYEAKVEYNVSGSIRYKGKCLQLGEKNVASFEECIKGKKTQVFKFYKNGSKATITNGEKYITAHGRKNNMTKLAFGEESKALKFEIKAKKYGYFILKSTKDNKCVKSPFDDPVLSNCKNIKLGKLQFIREGYSPEENKLENNEYANRNKVKLGEYNQIIDLSGHCAYEGKKDKRVEIQQCKSTSQKYMFKITKSGKYYHIDGMLYNVNEKKQSIFSLKNGKKRNFKIESKEGSIVVKAAGSGKCLTSTTDADEKSFELQKCSTDNLSQAFAFQKYTGVYDS